MMPPKATVDGMTCKEKVPLLCDGRDRIPLPNETTSPKTPPSNRPTRTMILIQENSCVGIRGGFFGGVFRTPTRAGGVEPARGLEIAGMGGGVSGIGGMRGV